MSAERTLERYAVQQAGQHGIFCRKVQWIGKNGAPDRLFLYRCRHLWVEFKAPKGATSLTQDYEHALMRSHGADVRVVRKPCEVDAVIDELLALPKTRAPLLQALKEELAA